MCHPACKREKMFVFGVIEHCQKYCVPAISAPSERLLSKIGILFNDRRNRLTAEKK